MTIKIALQIDMPPQRMLYYVPAQRGWVKNEVEELIEVCASCLCKPLLHTVVLVWGLLPEFLLHTCKGRCRSGDGTVLQQ